MSLRGNIWNQFKISHDTDRTARGDKNIYVAEVERTLAKHSSTAEAILIGCEDSGCLWRGRRTLSAKGRGALASGRCYGEDLGQEQLGSSTYPDISTHASG